VTKTKSRCLQKIFLQCEVLADPRQTELVSIDNTSLAYQKQVKYLGVQVTSTGQEGDTTTRRIQAASRAFAGMKSILTSSRLTMRQRCRLYTAVMRPCLLYGASSTAQLTTSLDRMDRFDRHCQRVMTRGWFPRNGTYIPCSSAHLRKSTGLRAASEQAKEAKWRFFGHVLRSSPDRLPVQLTLAPDLMPKRRIGRPQHDWIASLINDALRFKFITVPGKHTLFQKSKREAQDRERWRTLAYQISKNT
jgi:hypothetical protein